MRTTFLTLAALGPEAKQVLQPHARRTSVSWPGLARPPTTVFVESCKVVGDRAKPGHDTGCGNPGRSIRLFRLRSLLGLALGTASAIPAAHASQACLSQPSNSVG